MFRTSVGVVVALAAAGCTDDLDYGTTTSNLDLDAFVMPQLPAAERALVVQQYNHLDPGDEVPRGLLEDTIIYFDMNKALIPKQRFFVVVDMSLHSGKDRYWLVDLTTGEVEPHKVAHGDGSDPDNDGLPTLFGNVDGSHKTSLGFYLTGEIYDGTHAHSMRLDGLNRAGSRGTLENNNARPRLIVMHEADYVDDSNDVRQGRSNGCLALDPSIEVAMVDRIHDGSLIYTATAPLDPPVGRTMPGEEMPDPEPLPDEQEPAETGGCSTSGGSAGLALALALAGVRRRRR